MNRNAKLIYVLAIIVMAQCILPYGVYAQKGRSAESDAPAVRMLAEPVTTTLSAPAGIKIVKAGNASLNLT